MIPAHILIKTTDQSCAALFTIIDTIVMTEPIQIMQCLFVNSDRLIAEIVDNNSLLSFFSQILNYLQAIIRSEKKHSAFWTKVCPSGRQQLDQHDFVP